MNIARPLAYDPPAPAARRAVDREWLGQAIERIEADFYRSVDTHLIACELDAFPGIALYLKDESSHPTGSLKHRLARSLLLYALCNHRIGPDTTIIEASSGSTAVSVAYLSRLLGLRFIAVMPRTVAASKIAAIRFHGGETHLVADPGGVSAAAAALASRLDGHFLDQFTYAERATDWRGNNNIAQSIFDQMARETSPVPAWIVCGAGTGGTSATIGRYIRYARFATQLCLADPERSVFHRHVADRSVTAIDQPTPSLIEGIGRPCVEPSFVPDVIDRVAVVTDAQSIGAMRAISARLGRRVGGSTGTNIWAAVRLIREMTQRGETGSVVTILCDSGDRYADTLFDDAWLETQGIDWRPAARETARVVERSIDPAHMSGEPAGARRLVKSDV